MCGRYTSTTSIDVLAETFAVEEVRTEPLPPRWNVAPTQPILAVAVSRTKYQDGSGKGHRVLGTFRWGLVPSWAKDPSVGSRMINARAEGIGDKPAYRKALLARRCLIPADAFYEWQAAPARPDGSSAGKRAKLPWAIRRKDGQPMAFAGLWEVWRPAGADRSVPPLRSAVIVTTAANPSLSPIHDRMPVVLPPEAWSTWLDSGVADRATLEALLVPAPDEWLEAWPVGTRVNKVDQDGPDLLEPVHEPCSGG